MDFNISNYIFEIAIVVCIAGIVCMVGDKMEGGVGSFIKIAASLVIALYISSPISELFKNYNGNFELPSFDSIDFDASDTVYIENLTNATLDNLSSIASAYLEKQLDVKTNEFTVSFQGAIKNESFVLEGCTLTLYSISALSKRDKIIDYIEDTFACPVVVIESVID